MEKIMALMPVALLVALDLASKAFFFEEGRHVLNRGVFLGAFATDWWVYLTLLLLAVLLYFFLTTQKLFEQVLYGLLLAGGFGNWVDRLLIGSVRDFIYYPLIEVWGNVADIYISVAFGLLCIHLIYSRSLQ